MFVVLVVFWSDVVCVLVQGSELHNKIKLITDFRLFATFRTFSVSAQGLKCECLW